MPLGIHDKVCRLQDITMPSKTEIYRYCKDCTDCLIKQVIEKCKEKIDDGDWTASSILQLFEIEECEQ